MIVQRNFLQMILQPGLSKPQILWTGGQSNATTYLDQWLLGELELAGFYHGTWEDHQVLGSR